MVCIGRILRTRGNKGELVIGLFPGAAAPGEGSAVELRSKKRVFPQTIEKLAVFGSDAIATFSGAHGIGEALRFVGCTLWADGPDPKAHAGEAPAAREGTPDVLGFRVFDRRGECWGTVKALPRFSLNQVLEVENEASGEIIYVPWHESLVVALDRGARTLVIDPPDGLRELNQ